MVAAFSYLAGIFAESTAGHTREYKRKFKEASDQLDDMREFAQKILSENQEMKSIYIPKGDKMAAITKIDEV